MELSAPYMREHLGCRVDNATIIKMNDDSALAAYGQAEIGQRDIDLILAARCSVDPLISDDESMVNVWFRGWLVDAQIE